MAIRWTHVTAPVKDLDASIEFFTSTCGMQLLRDRRQEGGRTAWVGPEPAAGELPQFALVLFQGEVKEPLDHLGFQCEHRGDLDAIAVRARESGTWLQGPVDAGGSVGAYVMVREPSGHVVEFTHGQPLRGIGA